MTKATSSLVWLALAVACESGCGKGTASTSGAPDSSKALAATCKDAGAAFAKAFAPLVTKNAPSDKKEALTKAVEGAILTSCDADQWGDEVLKCMAKMPEGRRDVCLDMLPKEKNAKFEAAVKEAQRKALGLADEKAGTAPGAAPSLTPPTSLKSKAFAFGERAGFAAMERVNTGQTPAIDAAFNEAKTYGQAFDIDLPALPALTTDKPGNGAAALNYVLDVVNEPFHPKVEAKAGKEAAAAFDMGLKAQVIRMMYIGDKRDTLIDSLTDGMRANATIAHLSPDVSAPLFAKIDALGDPDAVENLLNAWDTAVSAKLEAGDAPGGAPAAPVGGQGAPTAAAPGAKHPAPAQDVNGM